MRDDRIQRSARKHRRAPPNAYSRSLDQLSASLHRVRLGGRAHTIVYRTIFVERHPRKHLRCRYRLARRPLSEGEASPTLKNAAVHEMAGEGPDCHTRQARPPIPPRADARVFDELDRRVRAVEPQLTEVVHAHRL